MQKTQPKSESPLGLLAILALCAAALMAMTSAMNGCAALIGGAAGAGAGYVAGNEAGEEEAEDEIHEHEIHEEDQ